MLRGAVVACGVAIRRRIAAANMSAREADAQMYPLATDLEALFASGGRALDVPRSIGGDVTARVREIDPIVDVHFAYAITKHGRGLQRTRGT